jgi:hypothetical protein
MSPIFDSRFREVRKKNTQPIFGFIIKIYIYYLKILFGAFCNWGPSYHSNVFQLLYKLRTHIPN